MSQSAAHQLQDAEPPYGAIPETSGLAEVTPTLTATDAATPVAQPRVQPAEVSQSSSAPAYSLVARLLLSWLPTYGILRFANYDAATAAVNATVLTAVFAPTSRWIVKRARAQRLAYGPISAVVASAFVGYVFAAAIAFTLPSLVQSQLALAATSLLAAVLATVWYTKAVSPFGATQRVVVVGGGDDVSRLVSDAENKRARFLIVGIVADDPASAVAESPLLKGRTSELGTVIQELVPDLVVIAVQSGRPEIFRRLLDVAESDFSMLGLPEFYELAFGRLPIRELTPAWFMSTLHVYTRPYNRFSKRAFDISVALAGILLALPLIPFVVVVVKRTKGSLVYRQTRLGEHGELFTILKFRTMYANAESANGAVWAGTGDPRIIPGGGLLRRTRIDELPQLWNVLKGEMSIVGPRPERPEFIEALESAVPFWQQRALLRPGITGWAQIREGYTSDEIGAERKLSYDLWYLRHRSLTLDAVICARTIGTLVSGAGAR